VHLFVCVLYRSDTKQRFYGVSLLDFKAEKPRVYCAVRNVSSKLLSIGR